MADKLKLPVGIEDFREICRKDFYYIDKTRLIEQLLDSWGKVNLFTRPRRFGKTLNMSMLRYFFEIGTDKTLFEGLHISQRSDLCEEYMGKFPVVSLTLKGVDGVTFERAKNKLLKYIALEAERFNFLKNSDKLTDNEKQRYTRFDYLITVIDDSNHQVGPYFKFQNVNYSDLHTDLDSVTVGLNVHITAEVENYDSVSSLFYLKPVSVTEE